MKYLLRKIESEGCERNVVGVVFSSLVRYNWSVRRFCLSEGRKMGDTAMVVEYKSLVGVALPISYLIYYL